MIARLEEATADPYPSPIPLSASSPSQLHPPLYNVRQGVDERLSMAPAAQIPDSFFRRWLSHCHHEGCSLGFCRASSSLGMLSSWISSASGVSGWCHQDLQGAASSELIPRQDGLMHLQAGCQIAGGPLGPERVQGGHDVPDEQQHLANDGRNFSLAGHLDFYPSDSANSASSSFCASSLNQSQNLLASPSNLSSLYRYQVGSLPDFHDSVDTYSSPVPNEISHVSPAASFSLLENGPYSCPVPEVDNSCPSRFLSSSVQHNLGVSSRMVFERCSDQLLTSPASPDSVMLCPEDGSSQFQLNSGSELVSGTLGVMAKQEYVLDRMAFAPDVVRKDGELTFFRGPCQSQENLQSRMTSVNTSGVSQALAASSSEKSVVEGQNLSVPPASRSRSRAPYKVFSPGCMKRSSGVRALRRLDSAWQSDIAPLFVNEHVLAEDNGVFQCGESHKSNQGGEQMSHGQHRSDAWLVSGGSPASSVSHNEADLLFQMCPSSDDGLVEGPGRLNFGGSSHENLSAPMTENAVVCPDPALAKYDMLNRVAEALDVGNLDAAQVMLARLNFQLEDSPQAPRRRDMVTEVTSVRPIHDRVALLFKEGLMARLRGCESPFKECDPLDVLNNVSAFKRFSEVSPVLNFAYFSANRAILESMEGEAKFHVIDFEAASSGTQWASLLFEMAQQTGTPRLVTTAHGGASSCCSDIACCKPGLHLTMVGQSHKEMQSTGESLCRFAKELNVELTFHPVVVKRLGYLELNMLTPAQDTGPLAVNIVFSLHRLLDAEDFPKSGTQFGLPSCIPILKSIVDGLSPKVVTVVEKHVGLDSPSLTAWFPEALHHYSLLLQSITASIDFGEHGLQDAVSNKPLGRCESAEKALLANPLETEATRRQVCQWNETMDDFLFAPEIKEMIRWKELAMIGIHEVNQWRRRLEGSGLRPRHLSSQAEKEAECLLANFRGHGFAVSNKEGSLLLTWQGHPLVASSAWVCL